MASECWQITFKPQISPDENFLSFLDEYFEVTAQNYADNGQDEFIGYTSGNFDKNNMETTAKTYGCSLPPYTVERLSSENWLKDYVIKFDSFEIADFCIYGIHETTAPKTTKIPLQIYAATAFGSNHQTTQCCIKAISELYHQKFIPQSILDIGTGSGILSLCAAKLWPTAKILASDIDDEAVIVTAGNASNNNLATQIEAVQSDGYQNPLIKKFSPANLILCNILANPLISFAEDLSNNLAPKGYCILSGFIEDQVDDVITAHQKQGLSLIKLSAHDNWRAAFMQKD
ncbi:MAG: 50S ribosomal protein L11 methyltransferase [Alphaproteobacteria bacterium]|nr:50S ribosomal protein L11 methyltransferase [Alphaproteobacteria bacterium]